MLGIVKKALDRRSTVGVTVLGLALVGLIGTIGHVTGYELSFSLFYLVPIGLAAWYGRRWAGYVLCGVSALVWLLVDYTAGHLYSHWYSPVWNTAVRLGFLVVTTLLLHELRAHLRNEKILARTDGLTKVFNARAFKEVSERLLKLAARHRHPAALAYIDIDDFKAVNDKKGHSMGDRVLQASAGTLMRCVRATDVVGRLGGDEFAVCMPETGCAGAKLAFGRIHEALVRDAADIGISIGFSIGVAAFPTIPSTFDEALRFADSLMYRVKKAGKNKVICEESAGDGISAGQSVATAS